MATDNDRDLDFVVGDNSRSMLIGFVQRIERLEEERQALADDKTEVFAEAKASGFDTKIMRKAIQLRKMDPKVREEQEAALDMYMDALEAAGDDDSED